MLERLKEIRKNCGYSQIEAAKLLNVPLGTYRTWEQCRNIPNGEGLSNLADFFGCTVDELLGRTPPAAEGVTAAGADGCGLLRIDDGGAGGAGLERLAGNYRALTDPGRDRLLSYSDDLAAHPAYRREGSAGD